MTGLKQYHSRRWQGRVLSSFFSLLHPSQNSFSLFSSFHPSLIYQFFYLSRYYPVSITFSSCGPGDKLTEHRSELTQLWLDLLYDCFFSFPHEYYTFNQHRQERKNNKRQSNVKAGFQLGRKNIIIGNIIFDGRL